MKVALILEETIVAGGGFNQALSAIIQFKKIAAGRFDWIVLTEHKENLLVLKDLNIESKIFSSSAVDKLITWAYDSYHLQKFLNFLRLQTSFEKNIIRLRCELVYFLSPSIRIKYIKNTNFIATIWDNCHRDFPEFPEVRQDGEFKRRETIFNELPRAVLTIVDSNTLAERLHERYGLDRSRLLSMPFSPSPNIGISDPDYSKKILSFYGINFDYFFYPAQFWPHKNHTRILEALRLLKDNCEILNVVFVGGDKGNFDRVKYEIRKYDLNNQVLNLGFIPSDHLSALYTSCVAVLMPTYFGPTNLPPLEAWQFKRPLIYSSHLNIQCGEAAIQVNPDSAESIAQAMQEIISGGANESLIERGENRLLELANDRAMAENELLVLLTNYEARLRTWSSVILKD